MVTQAVQAFDSDGRSRVRFAGPMIVAILLAFFEGIDLPSMGLTMAKLAPLLHLQPSQSGVCASASLFGLVIGAFVGGRLSDTVGRRWILSVSTILMGAFSVATPFSWDFHSLLAVRFLTGLGMGGMLPLIIGMASESAPPHLRATAISYMLIAAPIGSIAAGFVSLAPDWRWIFFFGGFGPLLVLPAIFFFAGKGTIERRPEARVGIVKALFGEGRSTGTAMIWTISFFSILVNYLMINWLPTLLTRNGLGHGAANGSAIAYSVGAILGNLVLGRLTDRDQLRLAYVAGYLGAMACAFGLSLVTNLTGALAASLVIGFCLQGLQAVTFALTSSFYPAPVGATGVGAMISAGRCGSVVGPILAGLLLQSGLGASGVFICVIPALLLSLAVAMAFVGVYRRRSIA